ncbi:MAG: EAL domain-containing protein [candidate division FCPU426 bacterium]
MPLEPSKTNLIRSVPADPAAWLDSLPAADRENSSQLLAAAAWYCPAAVIIINAQKKVVGVNPQFCEMTGFAPDNISGQQLDFIAAEHPGILLFANLIQALRTGRTLQGEYYTCKKDGSRYWEQERLQPFPPQGEPAFVIGFLQDLTPRKYAQALASQFAFQDLLTELPNRLAFGSLLEETLHHSVSRGQKLALALLDLDRFKIINETLGHAIGDQLLQSVARRLRSQMEPGDALARMGGDEFILLLPYVADFQSVVHKIKKVMAGFLMPFSANQQTLHIKASCGISLFPEDGQDASTLLRNADSALSQAKSSGRNNYRFYTAKLNALALNELVLEMALRGALDQGELDVFYQPQVSLHTGRIVGVEALLRWQHPEFGMVPPDRFIPLAEETGMIVPIGSWVLRTACRHHREWMDAGLPDLRLAVNLSGRQFQEPEIVEQILGICEECRFDPSRLDLEITESVLLKDLNNANLVLRWLKKKGVTLTIDDFGTGYSSLQYLQRFAVDGIKVDRSFVRDCLVNPDNAALVSAICAIGRNFKLRLTAEGVEERDQLHLLKRLGCDEFQGYYFSQPLPQVECRALLQLSPTLSAEDPEP